MSAENAAERIWGIIHSKLWDISDKRQQLDYLHGIIHEETCGQIQQRGSYCGIHNTYPGKDEPCWQCTNLVGGKP